MSANNLEAKMNALLQQLGIPLRAEWVPDPNSEQHAKIDLENRIILIFDEDEEEATLSPPRNHRI